MENLELKLLEEFNKLQRYAVKTPVDKKGFWAEWQNIFTQVKFYKISIKTLLNSAEISLEEKKQLKEKLNVLSDLESYLRELKEVALQVKGFSVFTTEESSEEDDDIDDLTF